MNTVAHVDQTFTDHVTYCQKQTHEQCFGSVLACFAGRSHDDLTGTKDKGTVAIWLNVPLACQEMLRGEMIAAEEMLADSQSMSSAVRRRMEDASISTNSAGPDTTSHMHFCPDDHVPHDTVDRYISMYNTKYPVGAKRERVTKEHGSDASNTSEDAVPAPKRDLSRSVSSARPFNSEASQQAFLPPP